MSRYDNDDTDNEYHMPHLSNNVRIENFIKKPAGDIDTAKLPQTSTDMMVEYLANPDKLITEDNRWEYQKNAHNYSQMSDVPEDDLNQYSHQDNNDNNYSNTGSHHDTAHTHDTARTNDSHLTDNNDNKDVNDKENKKEDKPLSQEQLLLNKLDMLRKLCELKDAGVNISQNYSLNSDYNMMKYEYELHKSIRSKQNSVNWMSSMTLNCIYGIEMLNEKYNPFDIKLKGWSEQMNADVNNYYDVFGDLYEKYNTPGKGMAPEVKLLLMLSGSALKFHLQNTVVNSLPNLGDTLANNPQLAEKLRQKAISDKMKEQSNAQRDNLNQHMAKEHNVAAQKASDLQMLKEKQMEHLRNQQELAQRKQYEELQEKLNQNKQSFQNQPTIKSPVLPFKKNISEQHNSYPGHQNTSSQNISPQEFEDFKKQQLINQYMYMQQLKKVEDMIHTETDKSVRSKSIKSSKSDKSLRVINDTDSAASTVSINPNIDNIIKRSKNKTAANGKSGIILDDELSRSISIGSKKNKKKSGIKISM